MNKKIFDRLPKSVYHYARMATNGRTFMVNAIPAPEP